MKDLTSNKSQSIASIQSKSISNYQLALANDLSCIGKGHTVHCSGERTWFQNTDEKIQNLYFEEDILYVESSSQILMYNRLGHFVGSKHPNPFQESIVQSPYKTTEEILHYNEDQVPDRVMLFSGLGLLFIEGIHP